jgi:hypothetical protein
MDEVRLNILKAQLNTLSQVNPIKAMEIRKSIEDELSKSGEGSRGGKVIGHTKSGKPIYANYNHPSHKEFSKEDHKDAANIHEEKRINTVNSKDFSFNKDKHKELQQHKHGYAYHWSRSGA